MRCLIGVMAGTFLKTKNNVRLQKEASQTGSAQMDFVDTALQTDDRSRATTRKENAPKHD